jgi:hypothetical protein
MHALIRNGAVEKYPYSLGNLRRDNPTTSFPKRPPDNRLEDWGVFAVLRVDPPNFDPLTQDLRELDPELVDGSWKQVWAVQDADPAEVARRKAEKNRNTKILREREYQTYADPLFFKWQRGEGTQEEWLTAIQHIKELLPYVE